MGRDKLKRLKQLLTWNLERIDLLMSRAGEIPEKDKPFSFLHQAWVLRKKQLDIVKDLITFGETQQSWPELGYIKKDLHLLEGR